MELQSKSDFDRCMQRMEAWWLREVLDRPPVSLHVRSDRQARTVPEKKHASLREKWMDMEYAIDRAEAWVEAATYFGESFPIFYPNLGPELYATLFGCELEFGPATSWSIPRLESCRGVMGLEPKFDNEYWQTVRRGTELSIQRGAGKWITGMPDLHPNGDLLASLRDPQELCIELMDDPDAVREACDYTAKFYPAIFDDLWKRIDAAGLPATTWTPFLHAGRAYVPSCDFICMISPQQFRDAILPAIVAEMRFQERSIFHLDGPGALRHLDALLAQPELNAVQWVYGAGRGPAKNWIDVYQKIQAGGKGIQLLAENVDDAFAVAEHLKPEGVWFCIGGAYTRDEAQAILDRVERWAAGKRG